MTDIAGVQWGVVIGASLIAAVWDAKSRRIPNWLTVPLAATGLLVAVLRGGASALGDSLAACVVLAMPYLLLYALAGGGAGDVKMMGAIGAWVGLKDGVVVLIAVAIAGAVFGAFRIVSRYRRRPAGEESVTSISRNEAPQRTGTRQERGMAIPYGPAIFVGVCIGAWVVHAWQA